MNESGFNSEYADFVSREGGSNGPTLTVNYCCGASLETIDTNVQDGDAFSAVFDSSFGTHVVYETNDLKVSYAYRSVGAGWSSSVPDVFSGAASSPTITIDYLTNELYAIALQHQSIAMRSKTPVQFWDESSIIFPVTSRSNPSELGSNLAFASSTNSSRILLLWTE